MTTRAEIARLHHLARVHGVETRYRDAWGDWQVASVDSLIAVLHMLGAPVDRMADVPEALATADEHHESVEHVAGDALHAPTLPAGAWGVFAPAYALVDRSGVGMGTAASLDRLGRWCAGFGATFVSTLPLLACPPEEASPYSPLSRRFWSERVLDPATMPEMAASIDARRRFDDPDTRRRIAELRSGRVIDHGAVSAMLRHLVEPMADAAAARADSPFVSWLRDRPDVERFARYRSIADRFGFDWTTWPGDAEGDRDAEQYHCFVQFAADRALSDLAASLRRRGQTLALDVPVGTSRGGFDTWDRPDLFVLDASVGAPPDQFFTEGQNWGFPPVHPEVSGLDGHAWLRDAVAAHAEYAGLLRVDHVMGLHRIWWVPRGASARDGVYVRYPAAELFAVATAAAVARGTAIVGENLGTVPAVIDRELARHGWLGMYELQFGVEGLLDGSPLRIPARSLASLNTHDMATFAGWLSGADLREQRRLGQLDDAAEAAALEHRGALVEALRAELLGPGDHDDGALLDAALSRIGASRARAVQVSLEDLWGEERGQNVPGTGPERPNWSHRAALTLEEAEMDPDVAARMRTLAGAREPRAGEAGRPPCPVGHQDLHYFNEGTHRRAYDFLGAHPAASTRDGDPGVWFSVWAPNARGVGVMGDWNEWSAVSDRLEPLGTSGVWTGFVDLARIGDRYKYRIETRQGESLDKADPFAFRTELPPATASVVARHDWEWHDDAWMSERKAKSAFDAPVSIYEVHLGSFLPRHDDGTFANYREIAHRLGDHVERLGFTHVELLPVMEHPFYGSWGYQTTGYFAPTARHGDPSDLQYLVDHLHQRGIGVLFDWVPSHFPCDEHSLAQFDGTALFEHGDPRLGLHPDWDSCIFNYGRHEVRSFLLSSAHFWTDRFHADGLRVDAVASMLYRDYSREAGEWIPNVHGGRENLEAIDLLQQLNAGLYGEHPDIQTYAEESTAWPNVSRPIEMGGLGFGYKWDMGWMHDTLSYLSRDSIHRGYHHGELTFRAVYRASENFVLPLSHDEVVHGKGSLLGRMSGDRWQQLANLRLLLAYQWSQPGKKLLFAGGELAQPSEWSHEASFPFELLETEAGAGTSRLVQDLNRVYREFPALHELDCDAAGFEWVDADDATDSVLSYLRLGRDTPPVLVVANFTPVPRLNHRVGVPTPGHWREIINTDAQLYGGSGHGNLGGVDTVPIPVHGRRHSVVVVVPPLALVAFTPSG